MAKRKNNQEIVDPSVAGRSKQQASPSNAAPKVYVSSATAAADREADKASMGQVRMTMVFLGFVAAAYVLYLVFTGQVDDFVTSLAGVDLQWIIAGVACFLCYYVFGVMSYAVAVMADPTSPVGIRDLMSVEASGVFFMRLTPGGAGVIPAQIYRLSRAGLSLGAASALQFIRFVLYEAGEGIFAGIMLLACGGYFLETFADVKILGLNITFIGIFMFGYKIVQVGGTVILCLLPKPVMALGNAALRFANKRGWVKEERYQKLYDIVNTQVMEFASAFRTASVNVKRLLVIELITLLQLGCMYALPFFVLRSFGEPADFLTCLASGSMLELLINAIPLPGGTGGAEVGFAYLFQGMFGRHLAAGFVIWRAVEYLLPVVIAAPCMGMRSRGNDSLNRRWAQLRRRLAHFVRGDRKMGHVRERGVTVKPKKK